MLICQTKADLNSFKYSSFLCKLAISNFCLRHELCDLLIDGFENAANILIILEKLKPADPAIKRFFLIYRVHIAHKTVGTKQPVGINQFGYFNI